MWDYVKKADGSYVQVAYHGPDGWTPVKPDMSDVPDVPVGMWYVRDPDYSDKPRILHKHDFEAMYRQPTDAAHIHLTLLDITGVLADTYDDDPDFWERLDAHRDAQTLALSAIAAKLWDLRR